MARPEAKRMAYVEVLESIKKLNNFEYSRIPSEVINYYEKNKLEEYHFEIDNALPLEEQISEEAKAILTHLYIKFIATSDDKKDLFKQVKEDISQTQSSVANEKVSDKLQAIQKQKQDDKRGKEHSEAMMTKETWVQRLFRKIKKMVGRG